MNTKRWIIDSMASWGGALVAAIVITYFRYMDQYVLLWPPERVGMGFVSLHVPEQQPCLVQLRFFYRLMHNLTTYWALIF
ncbi:hypothetical protein HY256_05730, partial [Candidatus Sumerlaeota bacterium]|nr:hypothetical protein [Candidatus Sumerlaeota bacterium]